MPKQFKHFSCCYTGLIGDVWEYVPHSFPHSSKSMLCILLPKTPQIPHSILCWYRITRAVVYATDTFQAPPPATVHPPVVCDRAHRQGAPEQRSQQVDVHPAHPSTSLMSCSKRVPELTATMSPGSCHQGIYRQ